MKNDMPKRKSPLLLEIGNKKVLQDEQIIIALNEYEKLLYYISGGNEKPKTVPQDKVRPEDADLRGWFTQAYGKDYLILLTSDLENTKEQGPRVNQIVAKFEENAYGFDLRVGAVNEYHLGRIIAHATNVYEARTEASAYSKEIAILSIRLLLSSNPPNRDSYPSMHNSIANWYELNNRTMNHNLDTSLANDAYYTYCGKIILSLFDIHKNDSSRENWHQFNVPGTTETTLDTILSAIDGVSSADLGTSETERKRLNTLSHRIDDELATMVNAGWNQKPLLTQAIKDIVDNLSYHHAVTKSLWKIKYAAGLKIGDELPRNLPMTGPVYSGGGTRTNSSDYWIDYDTWVAKSAEYATRREQLTAIDTTYAAQKEADVSASYYYDINGLDIYNTLMGLDNKQHAVGWMNYCYARVKKAYALNFNISSISLI